MAITQHGYLVLADISGYTAYLAGVELEHAHEILTELLELIVERFKSMLTIAKLEGDAVFAYVPLSGLARGETLIELVEATYAAFRDRARAMHRRTTCECKACRGIPMLDLKFLAHHGSYIIQNVAGIHELVGTDVNLVHRLLKNHIAETTGWRAYALFTDAVLDHLGVRPDGMTTHTESYDLGEVQAHAYDLHERYQALTEARRVVVAPETAYATIVEECDAPPAVVWDWLNSPEKRAVWEHAHMVPALRPGGRTGSGARNHCVHGKSTVMIETVLDWRPFEYFTVEKDCLEPFHVAFLITIHLEPIDDGRRTRLRAHTGFRASLPRLLLKPACNAMIRMYGIKQTYRDLARLIADQMSRAPIAETALAAA